MKHASLTLLVLKTKQIERLRAFYETIGVELGEEKHGSGPVHFAGRMGEVIFEVYPLAGDGLVDSTTRLGFAVDDLTGVVEALGAIGSPVVSPPKETPSGVRAVVRDPDGRAVEVYER